MTPRTARPCMGSLALVLTMVVGSGCATSSAAERTAGTSVSASPTRREPVRAEVACLDVTGSVPRLFTEQAREWFTRRIERAARGPMGTAAFYLRVTSSSSYGSQAGLAVATLPAVAAPPADPPVDPNPYKTAARTEADREHQADVARWRTTLDAVKLQAVAAAARFRQVPLPVDNRGTDVTGCAIKAADLLRTAQERTLVMAGDLQGEGPQQSVVPDLRGVDLVVVQWCADDAATCIARRRAFGVSVDEKAAASITDLDPQQLL